MHCGKIRKFSLQKTLNPPLYFCSLRISYKARKKICTHAACSAQNRNRSEIACNFFFVIENDKKLEKLKKWLVGNILTQIFATCSLVDFYHQLLFTGQQRPKLCSSVADKLPC